MNAKFKRYQRTNDPFEKGQGEVLHHGAFPPRMILDINDPWYGRSRHYYDLVPPAHLFSGSQVPAWSKKLKQRNGHGTATA